MSLDLLFGALAQGNLLAFEQIVKEALDSKAIDSVVNEARFVRKNKIRRGKVLRRHKVATRKGYTFRKGKVTRMSAQERRKRKLSQIKGARKRKATKARAIRKRKITNRKRTRLFGK